jgi:DNA-binding GntR family transcriptional regulator
LEEFDVLEHSLYELLEGHYGLRLDHTTQTMEAAGADAYQARLLGIAVHAPVALVRGVTFLDDGQPIEYFRVIYRGDRFRFQLQTVRLRKEA